MRMLVNHSRSSTRSSSPARSSDARLCETLENRVLLSRAIGIDVSNLQGAVDWNAVYSSGRRFAWAKATEGVTFNDSQFSNNLANCPSGNVVFGAYHYARYDNGNSATAEADHFISIAGGALTAGYLRPVVDVEQATSMSVSALSTWVNTWCNRVLSVTGCRPIVYTYVSFASAHLDSSVTQWALWMASYNGQDPQTGAPSGTAPWAGWNFWQYGDAASIPGVGNVDADVAHGDMTSYVIPSYTNHSSLFTVGQTVHVTAASGLKAWDTYTSNGSYVVEPNGKTGTIQGGPVFIDGYERWRVRYSGDSVDRWSAQDWLASGTGSPASMPAPGGDTGATTITLKFSTTEISDLVLNGSGAGDLLV